MIGLTTKDEVYSQNKDFIDKLLSEIKVHKPWEYEGSIWKTEGQYVNWLRSQFRSIWSDYPIKNAYQDKHKTDLPKLGDDGEQLFYKTGSRAGQPVTVKGYICELTGKEIKASKPKGQRHSPWNIDHIDPAGSCTTVEEALVYFLRLLTSPDNLQLIDTEIHKVINHYDKYKESKGFTCFNDASAHKKMISVTKNTKAESSFLKKKGLVAGSNSKERKQQIYEYFKQHIDELDYVLDYK